MTDFEMTKLCAEAMGLGMPEYTLEGGRAVNRATQTYYSPLTDDAQAMALVRRIGIEITPPPSRANKDWCAIAYSGDKPFHGHHGVDLNRAIVECVAKMHASKS